MLIIFAGCILFVAYIVVGKVALQGVIRFLTYHEVTANNFASQKIPYGLGIYVWVMVIIYYFTLRLLDWVGRFMGWILDGMNVDFMNHFANFLIALSVIMFVGWLDDTIGDKEIKGFSGHLKKWKEHRILTTGLLKAVVTSVMAGWLVLEVNGFSLFCIVQGFILILMTNSMNLLDLRPGRMMKVFFALTVGMLIFASWSTFLPYIFPVLFASIMIFPQDVKAKVMLGDTGANLIGFTLGFCIVIASSIWFQIVILGMLIVLHWIAAKSSITKLVEHSPLLNWIDRWGRA